MGSRIPISQKSQGLTKYRSPQTNHYQFRDGDHGARNHNRNITCSKSLGLVLISVSGGCIMKIIELILTFFWNDSIQQYHSALLLLMEIFAFPDRKEADRIWRCLDYVFEIPANIPKDQRGRWVMTEVRDKMGIYIASRKVMAPSSMLERIGSQSTHSGSTTSVSPPISVGKVRQGNGDFAYSQPPGTTAQHTEGLENFRPGAPAFTSSAPPAAMQVSDPPIQGDKTIDIDWVCRNMPIQRDHTNSHRSMSGTSCFHQITQIT